MPIYEYRCQTCGHYVDVLQKLSDDPLRQCPECNTEALKRLVSAPAFRLKGGGWYETDFKSDKDKRRNLAESADGGAKSDSDKSSKSSGGEGSSGGESKAGDGASKSSESASKSSESASKSSGSSGESGGGKSAGSADGSQSKAAV